MMCFLRFFSILTLCGFFLVACNEKKISAEDKELYLEAIDQGNSIVSAVDRYKKEIGKFPDELSELVPKYMESTPTVANYSYFNKSNINGYKGPDGFIIIFSTQKSFSLIWHNESSYFLYDSEQDYSETEKREVHFVIDGWAYVTGYRHRIGEAGRIE